MDSPEISRTALIRFIGTVGVTIGELWKRGPASPAAPAPHAERGRRHHGVARDAPPARRGARARVGGALGERLEHVVVQPVLQGLLQVAMVKMVKLLAEPYADAAGLCNHLLVIGGVR